MSRSYAVELSRTSALRPQGNSPQRAVRLRSRRCHRIRTHSTDQNDEQENIPKLEQSDQVDQTSNSRRGRKADSTDAIASALTRRFGLAGGLAWLGFLTFGVVSEQIKTRLEVASEQAQTKDVSNKNVQTIPGFPGVEYYDERVGGGAFPRPGDLVILSFRGYANGELFVDTYDSQKPIVFLYKSRPFTGGVCPGVEAALASMRAGGKRHVVIPPEYGFGEAGISLKPTLHVPQKQGIVPGGARLEYDLELVRVSIPPS